MYWVDGIELINMAREKRNEGKAWQMWLMQYINMTEKTFTPFKDFYKQSKNTILTSERPKEDILSEAKNIRKSLGKAW